MTRERLEKITGTVFFLSVIAAHFLFGITAAIKLVGISCLVTGAIWCVERSIPVGIEGRIPSFFLSGIAVLIIGLIMIALGFVLLFYSTQAACILG